MSPARLCILGSINADLVVRVPRLPRPGETIAASGYEAHPGGKGANQAVASARMGASTVMLGRVGDDEHGRWLRGVLSSEGIDAARVLASPPHATGVALISVDGSGENTIVIAPGANGALTPADVHASRDAIFNADVLVMSLETPLDAVAAAAEIARETGTRTLLNAAPARPLPPDLLERLDALVCNEGEAAEVAGSEGRYWSLPIATLVMTQGARGACYQHEGRLGEVAPHRITPVDTVGAGDAFVGAFATRVAEHQVRGTIDDVAILDAVCWANAAGALAATRAGAIPSLPRRSEVIDLLRTNLLAD